MYENNLESRKLRNMVCPRCDRETQEDERLRKGVNSVSDLLSSGKLT